MDLPLSQSLSRSMSMAGREESESRDPSDWKKLLLITGLGTLSWISTYTGMLELIQANMGDITLTYKGAIAFAVAMLMLMIIWLLDQLFGKLSIPVRVIFTVGYIFLTIISIGFGFGFYWKFLESRSEASRSAESAVTQVNSALLSAQTRLEQLQTTLITLTSLSKRKAISERERGNSCPNSRPGDGPRRRLRDADAANFEFAGTFVSTRVANVKSDIATLSKDLSLVAKRHKSTIDPKTGTRNIYLRGLNQKLNNSVTRFNAFRTDPQLNQFRNSFAERASKTIFPNGKGGTFTCPDPQLQAALRGVVAAIDQLPELEKPRVAAVEGSEAIIEAFRRLTVTLFGAITLKMPPTPDELRAMQQRAVQSVSNIALQRQINARSAGLGSRDYIPLAIAVFVDFCLLLVSMTRPMHGFRSLEKKMFEAEEWPIIQILARFRDIHSDEDIRQTFDIFRHVVFDYMGDYYVGVPLKAPANAVNREDAQLEAHLLSNLFTSFEKEGIFKRVVWPNSAIARKRLTFQDSKFGSSEAFRIYRFKDGAWSDWVLGAIMGAAKRVEEERERRRLHKQLYPESETAFEQEPLRPAPTMENIMAANNAQNQNGAGQPDFGQSGYSNVEAFPNAHANQFRAPENTGPVGYTNPADVPCEGNLRANGTDGGVDHFAERRPPAEQDNINGNGNNANGEQNFSNDNAAGDVIQLPGSATEFSANGNIANGHDQSTQNREHGYPDPAPVKTTEASTSDGTIRLKRETVEFDTSAVNALGPNSNGDGFVTALRSALNPPFGEDSAPQASLQNTRTEEMVLLGQNSGQNQQHPGQTIPATVDNFIQAGETEGFTQTTPQAATNGSDTQQYRQTEVQTEEIINSGYADEWEEPEPELQIENITRWFSRRDPDPKSS